MQDERKMKCLFLCWSLSNLGDHKHFEQCNSNSCDPKKLRDKCDPKWFRISMSHHNFTDSGEIFQGDSNDELMEGVTSKDFMDSNFDCVNSTTVNGKCICGSDCRKPKVVHKATFKECLSFIGRV